MKKYTFVLLVILQAPVIFCQSPTAGRVKITIENLKCITKSWDGVVEFDGHGNEISVAYSYRIYNSSNPNAARKGSDGTVIYGSNVNGMTRAGTQTPDLGGITDGDVVNIFKPVLDEHINADDYIIIAPTVWEWDGPEKNTFITFNQLLDDDLFWVISQPFPFSNTAIIYADPFAGRVNGISYIYPSFPSHSEKYEAVFKKFICPTNGEGNKPIGLAAGTYNGCGVKYQPTILVLDSRVLYDQYLNNKRAATPAVTHAEKEAQPNAVNGVTITFSEGIYVTPDSHGKYTVTFKIEFIPDVTAPSAPVISNTAISKIPAAKNINISNSPLMVAGNWAGTQTNDYGLYPQNFGFELTSGGEIIMKDSKGVIACKGNFTLSNNIITGWYKQFSSGETFSLSASFDPAAQKINGTLGSGTAVTGQGKWIVTRK
jgi:hypothetical protein